MRYFSNRRPPLEHAQHNTLESVQLGFGLVQQDVARLLGVSRATLAMDGRPTAHYASSGTRDMPFAAWERLLKLGLALPAPLGSAPAAPEPNPAPPLPDAARRDLDLRLRGLELKQYPMRQQLQRVQLRLAQARRRLHALPVLQAAFPDERGQRWLEWFAEEARYWLRTEGHQPRLLELKLRVLEFEAAEIRKLLSEA